MAGFSIGSVIGGRFELLAPLDAGGMGTVFKAHDRQLGVDVAVKILRLGRDPRALERFHSEVRLARLVKHPNVCSVHEYGEDGEAVYCAMELVEGHNLRQVLREKALAWPRAYEIAIEAAEGLKAIHDAGILHRDVKSSNVMIDLHGHVRLVDFGIACQWHALPGDGPSDAGLTDERHVVGSPEYMSPEQVRDASLDARSDIYSFGIVLYELFTGAVPFHGATPWDVMEQQVTRPPLEARVAASLPGALLPVLERALAKLPDDRYANAAALIADLRAAQERLADTDFVPLPAEPADSRWTVGPLRRSAFLTRARSMIGSPVAAWAGVLAFGLGIGLLATVWRPAKVKTTDTAGTKAAPNAVDLGLVTPTAPAPTPSDTPRSPGPKAAGMPGETTVCAVLKHPPAVAAGRPTSSPTSPEPARRVSVATPPPSPTSAVTPAVKATPPADGVLPPLVPRTVESAEARPPSTHAASANGTGARPPDAARRTEPQPGWLVAGETGVVNADCGGQPARYSPQAERLGVEGRVLVDCVINEQGRVVESRAVHVDDEVLRKLALDSVKSWRCRPATWHGVPGRMRLQIPIEFRLPKD